jgi:large subunit ribosomal protein L20
MRVKTGQYRRKRHKKLLSQVKGYRQSRSKIFRRAKEAYMHAGQYAFRDRQKRAGQMRSLWILRLNAALKDKGISYSKFINKLNNSEIDLDRKSLSELAIQEPQVFSKVVDKVVG